MPYRRSRPLALALVCGLSAPLIAAPLENVLTYQGRLDVSGQPATGLYDIQVCLFDDPDTASPVQCLPLHDDVPVEDGLFALDLAVDPAHLDGSQLHLELRVRNGDSTGGLTALVPRQPLRTTPYALTAVTALPGAVNADSLQSNAVTATKIASNAVSTAKIADAAVTSEKLAANSVDGSKIADGSITAADVDATHIQRRVSGTCASGNAIRSVAENGSVTCEAMSAPADYWRLDGNADLTGAHFIGTTTNMPLRFLVNRRTALRLYPGTHTANVVGGTQSNSVPLDLNGATISGGADNWASGHYSAVAGGIQNTASGERSFVAGGTRNCAGGDYSFAAGLNAKVRPGSTSGETGYGCSDVALSGTTTGDHGTFVWADRQPFDFISTAPNQFLVRAQGGMAINTNAPRAPLTVTTENKWNPAIGNGWGDFTIGNANYGLSVGVSTGGLGAGTSRVWAKGGAENIVFTNASMASSTLLHIGGNGRVGVGRSATANAFEVEGNASKSTAGDWLSNSDARIKTDVRTLASPLDTLLRLRPVSFRYTEDYLAAHPGIEDLTYYNVIAQEFAQVFPEAVKPSGQYLPGQPQTPENAVLQVDFHPASVLTIAAVQELALRLEQDNAALREELAALRAAVAALTP